MNRIIIIGCGGAGKSTLARQLGTQLSLPVVHLDQLFWKGDWEHIPRDEFDAKLAMELDKPQWIMDGNFDRTLPQRIARCDTIIYLDFHRVTCLWGLAQRLLRYHGKSRPDMPQNMPERLDWSFVKWIWNYNSRNRENNYRLLNEATGVETIVLKNRRMVRRFLRSFDN